MAYTPTDLQNIERALASGRLTVSFQGRSVTYRSFEELRRIRDMIADELGEKSSFWDRATHASSSKGDS